jgi:UDP-N-acetylmuramyl-tripeptide synthetase
LNAACLQTPELAAHWLRRQVRGSLRTDSRSLVAGDGFIAWPGAATDGRRFVPGALQDGAAACLVEHDGWPAFGIDDERVATYGGLKSAAAPIAAAYYEHPSRAMRTVAVTGTNGKTSTAWWLAQALTKLGTPCGIIGTLGIGTPDSMVHNGLTTPDPVLLQQQLRHFADSGFGACAIEASSIGLAEHRLDATHIDTAVFTNFTQDHLDYHGSMEAYWQAKRRLFAWPGLRAAVLNTDDSFGRQLESMLAAVQLEMWTVSQQRPARLVAGPSTMTPQGMSFEVSEGTHRERLHTGAIGNYNVLNLLGVVAALRAGGYPLADAVDACAGLLPVPGRLQTLAAEGLPLVAVDYAHTPDALEKVLFALRPLTDERGGKLWCVFGCGGDRDASKRPLMGRSAQAFADRVVVTSDNPRSEDARAIIDQVVAGMADRSQVDIEPDRDLAIQSAVRGAAAADVIVIAGKGHETTQDIGGIQLRFSDLEHARLALDARAAGPQP